MFGTNLNQTKPFDHIFYDRRYSGEIKQKLNIFDMRAQFRGTGNNGELSNPLMQHNIMTKSLSDHAPIQFFIKVINDDDPS